MIAVGTQCGIALVFENKQDVERLVSGLTRFQQELPDDDARHCAVYLLTDDNVERPRYMKALHTLAARQLPEFFDYPHVAFTYIQRGTRS